jgi:MFS transporter, DHA1 family, tetracycline resistance protein
VAAFGGESGHQHDANMKRARSNLPPGFGTIWTTVAIDLIGFGIVLPVLPLYAERFGATPTQIGALLASFSVAQLLFAPVWGWVSDRIGRKPVLVLSLAGTAVGSVLTGLAGSLTILFCARVLDGISGASVSVAQASVADVATPKERARLFGLLGTAFAVGFIGGPAIGALAALWSPRVPFLVAGAIAGANAIVAIRRLPETNPRGVMHRTEDDPGAHWMAGTDRRVLARLVVLSFLSLSAFSAFEATFALFGERRLGLHISSTAAVFTGVGVVLAVVQGGLVRPVVRRLGEGGTVRAGLLINGVGLLLLAAVRSWLLLVPALGALVLGEGLAMPAMTASFAARAGTRRGRALGVQQSAGGLARVVGPLAGGMAFQHIGAPAPYVGGSAVMLLCAAATARLSRVSRESRKSNVTIQ